MTSPRDRQTLQIRLKADLSRPELLAGLEAWLQLGLIDDNQVRQLARLRLSCQIPEPVIAKKPEPPPPPLPSLPPAPSLTTEERVDNFLSRAWNAFREELSVRWLLFLGVFAVLVASGGLAATQWESFSPVAQYLVLWAYTLTFGGIGTWLARQPRSRLTAAALQTIATLLIPINFWAMDTLIGWENPFSWLIIALAAITLSGWLLWDSQQPFPLAVTFLGTSYLHWGWTLDNWPTVAVHLGAIASTVAIILLAPQQRFTFSVYAVALLLGRAIGGVGVPLTALDFAIAICGWLLTLNQADPESLVSKVMERMGATLLLVAWGLGWGEPFPWSAAVATAFALEFLWRRLRQFWRCWHLLALFGVGLQGWGLLWQLLPLTARSQGVELLESSLGLETGPPWLLPSLGLFPYLIIFLGLVKWLDQVEQPQLARWGEGLVLGVGALLTVIAAVSPSTRSLTLWFYSLALTIIIANRARVPLIYLARIVLWLAVLSSIDWILPTLTRQQWGSFFLVAMVGEWAVSTQAASRAYSLLRQVAQRSGWYFGFVFAGLSFVLLGQSDAGTLWRILWLVAPITLTLTANYQEEGRQKIAARSAIMAAFLAQGLLLSSLWTRLLGWSVATGLVVINARYFPSVPVMMLPVGAALALGASPFWGQLQWPGWTVWSAIALIILWSATALLARQRKRTALLYARATNNWGIMVCIGVLSAIALHGMRGVAGQSFWQYPLAASLTTLALTTRYWQAPRAITGYSVLIAIELTAIESLHLTGGTLFHLAMVNLGLGLLTLVSYYRLPTRWMTTSLEIAPLGFAGVAMMSRLNTFTAYTGLLTLAAAIIALFVGSHHQTWKGISYLALVGILLGSYELAIFPFPPISSPQSLFNLLSLLVTVTLTLALMYRSGASFLHRQARATILGLSLGELKRIAHCHWGLAGCFAVIATLSPLSNANSLSFLNLGNGILLTAYALVQGYQTRQNRPVANAWFTAGWLTSELVIAAIIHRGDWFVFALTHLILGLAALVVTAQWRRRGNLLSRLGSIELFPLFLASVGVVARFGHFTAATGGLILTAAIVGFGVGGRRKNWAIVSQIALVAVSWGCYELMIYAIIQSESGLITDTLSLLAAVAAGLALVQRSLAYWARSRDQILGLRVPTLRNAAHLHWLGGSVLRIAAIGFTTDSDPKQIPLGIAVSLILGIYAVIQGREQAQLSSSDQRAIRSDWWVYVGLVQLLGVTVYSRQLWEELAVLDPWIAVLASLLGLILLQLPWGSWGWNLTPWHRIAIALPAVRVVATAVDIEWFNLFLVAGFYGRIAWRTRQIRWSYGSLGLVAWGIAQLLARFQQEDPLWYALLIGLPLLYVASVDPILQSANKRRARHWLRLFASGMMSGTALFYHSELGLAPTLMGLIFVFAGIALQVRAFLLIGTATLLLTGGEQVISFSQAYPFAKWAIALVAGIILIAIAASFESRRDRMISTFQTWRSRFQQWE